MPVIELSLKRLESLSDNKFSREKILDSLPYLGLDLEDVSEDSVSVEYSPNRPDFSSEAGIARSLLGYLGIETGLPKYSFRKSNFVVKVAKDEIKKGWPFIVGLYAKISISEEMIKKLITMQEDLTNGIGRHRRYVAIGIHNASVIKWPIRYFSTRDRKFSFVPLDQQSALSIGEILSETEQGRKYGTLLSNGVFPLLEDADRNVLSMPPVINSELTRLKPDLNEIFIDVTGTDRKACETANAIMASMLADEGANVFSITIEDGKSKTQSPNMEPARMKFDLKLARSVLGLDLSPKDARNALRKSRLDLVSTNALIPRYRADVIHPVDLVEEVELGWGVSNLKPAEVRSSLVGSLHARINRINSMVEVLVGLGMTEIVNLSLTGELESSFFTTKTRVLKVDDARSQSYEFLRAELAPSLLSVLGASTHEEYPQRIFEQGPVFYASGVDKNPATEEEHLAAAVADSNSNLTSMISLLNGFASLVLPEGSKMEPSAIEDNLGIYAGGRSGTLWLGGNGSREQVGFIGEIHPMILERFRLKVPVALFELNLEPLLRVLPPA